MTKCQSFHCDSTELVYSGVDAFLLGVPTETWCYDCANFIARQNREYEDSISTPTTTLTTSC